MHLDIYIKDLIKDFKTVSRASLKQEPHKLPVNKKIPEVEQDPFQDRQKAYHYRC